MKKLLNLQEGRLKFQRFNCKTGNIDRYCGDLRDKPNIATKPKISLNLTTIWYRLNNNEWENFRGFDATFLEFLFFKDEFDAVELYEYLKELYEEI